MKRIFVMLLLFVLGCGGSGDDPLSVQNTAPMLQTAGIAFPYNVGDRIKFYGPDYSADSGLQIIYRDLEGDVELLTITLYESDGTLGENDPDDFYNRYYLYVYEDWEPLELDPDIYKLGPDTYHIVNIPGVVLPRIEGEPGVEYEIEFKVSDRQGLESKTMTLWIN